MATMTRPDSHAPVVTSGLIQRMPFQAGLEWLKGCYRCSLNSKVINLLINPCITSIINSPKASPKHTTGDTVVLSGGLYGPPSK